jgi:hypothetical protein
MATRDILVVVNLDSALDAGVEHLDRSWKAMAMAMLDLAPDPEHRRRCGEWSAREAACPR